MPNINQELYTETKSHSLVIISQILCEPEPVGKYIINSLFLFLCILISSLILLS